MYFRLEDVQGVSEQELRSNPALSKHFLSRREDGEENQKDDLIRVEFTVGCGTTGVDRRLEAALATFFITQPEDYYVVLFITIACIIGTFKHKR